MAKVKVEFINTCASCNDVARTIREVADRYGNDVDVTFYAAGKDFGYLRKYGMIARGTMIINGKTRYETLSRDVIEKAIGEAVQDAHAL